MWPASPQDPAKKRKADGSAGESRKKSKKHVWVPGYEHEWSLHKSTDGKEYFYNWVRA